MADKLQGNPPTQASLRRIFWELGSRYPIPDGGGDRIAFASVSAQLGHLNWSISEQTIAALKQELGAAMDGARLVLRIHDVTSNVLSPGDPQTFWDVEVDSLAGNYYLRVPTVDRELYSEIGLRQDGSFQALARSNTRYFDHDGPVQDQETLGVYEGAAVRPPFEVDSGQGAPVLERANGSSSGYRGLGRG